MEVKPSKDWCCVPDCKSDGRKRGRYPFMNGVKFFPFPSSKRNPKMRKKWLDMIMRPRDYEPGRSHRVCSLHFVDGEPTESNPVPTLFPRNNYGRPPAARGLSAISKRDTVTGIAMEVGRAVDVEMTAACIKDLSVPPVVRYEEVTTVTSTPRVLLETCVTECECIADHSYSFCSKAEITVTDSSCQTDLTMKNIEQIEKFKITDGNKDELLRDLFIDKVTRSDKSVLQYTGIPSKKILNGLFDIMNEAAPKLKYWSGQGTADEVPYQQDPSKKKTGPERKLTRYQEFILTLVRLRLALLSFFLSDLFGVSETRISQIFTTWINFMHCVFTPLLKWQSSTRIKKYLPRSFKLAFPKTTCIIDSTEFFIEKPKSPTAQSQTYSSYKHRNTYKALVSITPSGAFNFISNLWGGNTSDRYITKECGFLDKIKPGDEVMADRGFLIRDLLLERKATLNIPPFTKTCKWGKGKRLNFSDIKKTRNIARLRIHVERAIERLKRFHILAGTMSLTMKSIANQIVKVCGFLCNLYKPLVTK